MMRIIYECLLTVALSLVTPGSTSGVSDECLACLPKSWSHTPPDDKCIDWLGKTYCGRWGISKLYYDDCKQPDKDDFQECSTNVTCARDCVKRYLDRYTRNCKIQLSMPQTDDIGCREYTAIHSGGSYGCQNIATNTDIQDRIGNMSVVCPTVIAPATAATSTAAPTPLSVILPATIIPVVVILVIVLLGAIVLRRRKMRSEEYAGNLSLMKGSAKPGIINASYLSDDVKQLLTTRALPKSAIEIEKRIGSGHFGEIYMGTLHIETESKKTVAVKMLKSNSFTVSDAQHFLSEALVMASFSHEKVLGLIGVCWEEGELPLIIMPYMGKGDLLTLIKSDSPKLSIGDIIHFSLQIAEGMEYLSSKKFVHRDLAARNCLVSDYFLVKISDFGLSRDVYGTNYYIVEEGRQKPLPWKWMALESIKEGKFSTQSDVWSFGVVLWELFTYGSTPYPAVGNLDELEVYLTRRSRLAQPEICPPDIYTLMKMCWLELPIDRPAFSAIVETMVQILKFHQNDSQYHYTFDFNGIHEQGSRNVGFNVHQSLGSLDSYCVKAKENEYMDRRGGRASLISADLKNDLETIGTDKHLADAADYDAASENQASNKIKNGNLSNISGSHLPVMQTGYVNVETAKRLSVIEDTFTNAEDQYIEPLAETSPL